MSTMSTMSTIKKIYVIKSSIIGLGFTTLFTQVFLIRETGVWLRGNEFVVAIVISAWLMWTATGCFIGFIFSKKEPKKFVSLAWLFSVIISVAELILLRCFWTFTGQIPGESINLGRAAILAISVTSFPCIFSGVAVGAAIKSLKISGNKSVAFIYLVETIGALIAGILVTFVFIPLQHWWFSIAVLFSIPLINLPLKGMSKGRGSFIIFKFLFIILFLFAVYKNNDFLEQFAQKTASRFIIGNIAADIDAPRERFTVTTINNESAFYINGRLSGSSVQRELAEEISWYSFLSTEDPETALLIGFPYNGLLREFLQKNLSKITIPNPEKKLIKNFAPFLLLEDSKVINLPQVEIIPEDCRTFLKSNRNKSYDIVVQNIGIPEAYSSSRLFSKEWFNIIAKHLSSNGTFTIVLPGSAGYVPNNLAQILSRTFNTMKSVFKFVTIIPTSSTLLIASNTKQIPNTPLFWLTNLQLSLSSESKSNKHQPLWFNSALIIDNLNNFRVAQFTNACAQFKSISVHKDLSPFLYGDSLLYSEARFDSLTHKILTALYGHRSKIMIISFMMLILWVGITYTSTIVNLQKTQTWFLMTTFSVVGFIGEMTLLIRFVIARGNFFYSIGLLFAGFMLGLAIATYTIEKLKTINRFILPTSVIILCLTLWTITFVSWPISPSFVMIFSFALNTICGLCVGTSLATLAHRTKNFKGSGIILYAADLCGALIGGLLFSIIIPPILGFGFLTAIITGTLILILPATLFLTGKK